MARSKKRVFILGIDGMDPVLTQDQMSAGHLPHLKQLAEKGAFRPLHTVNPAQSPAAWASMGTGLKPFYHGVSDFIIRKDAGYLPDLSLMKQNPANFLGNPNQAYVPPVDPKLYFWETLHQKGFDTNVVRWPMNFPTGGEGKALAGLGTPDLLGGMGRYTLFTTGSADRFPEDIKGTICPLAKDGPLLRGRFNGPVKQTLMGKKTVEIAVQFRVEGDILNIDLGRNQAAVKAGELSPWLQCEFALGFGVKAEGMVAFLPIQISPDQITVYMTPLQLTPERPLYPISSPPSWSSNLAKEIGTFHTLGMAEDTNALRDMVIDEESFLTLCDRVMAATEEMLWHTLKNFDAGFAAVVFDTTDRIQHMFWRYIDQSHSLHGQHDQSRYQETIAGYYRRMDRIFAGVQEAMNRPDDVLYVVSDHGFTHYRKSLHINRILADAGLLKLKDPSSPCPGLFDNVDLGSSQAFALGFSQVFINTMGRDQQGIVPLTEVAALKKKVTEVLESYRDHETGEKAITGVYDTAVEFDGTPPLGPDLVVGTAQGFRFSWQTALGATPTPTQEINDNKWSGDHCVDASHVPGVFFSNQANTRSEPLSLLDIAPSVLRHFGCEKDPRMTGRPVDAAG